MTLSGLLAATAIGTAALAMWCYVRWPRLAPRSLAGSIVRLLAAFSVLQLVVFVLDGAVAISADAALAAFVGVVVPALSFAFLAALWLMKLFADAFKGHI
jgi:hypothetical protein